MALGHLNFRMLVVALVGASACISWAAQAEEAPAEVSESQQQEMSPEARAYFEKLGQLKWVKGPTNVPVVGNATLQIPAGYMFLDIQDTDKYLELNENLSSGSEMLVMPESFGWSAYLSFSDEGYVKDDEQIDAAALLKSLQEGTEVSNEERRRRGWSELQLTGWAVPPAYNANTKRLEWATVLKSANGETANFFTKILGRKGYTTVVLAAEPGELNSAEAALNGVLTEYKFNAGDAYADFRPGDKVAAYGLAALVLGGAAALATKKGFWGVIAGFIAASWKFIAVGVVAVGALIKRLWSRKPADA